jgi:copper chaperone CopZ
VILLMASPALAQVISVAIPVAGMTCVLCTRSLEEAIREMDGIGNVSADLSDAVVRVQAVDGGSLGIGQVRDRVRRAGFKVGGECEAVAIGTFTVGARRRITFRVSGTSTEYQILEGHRFLRLMREHGDLKGEFRLRFRLHDHPYWRPPGISVTGFEAVQPGRRSASP